MSKSINKTSVTNAISKTKITTAIVLILFLTSVMLFAIPSPTVKAQLQTVGAPTYTPWATSIPQGATASITVPTTAWMSVNPNPIGLGQPLLVNLWLEPPSNTARFFSGYTVTITKPDGTTDTVGPLNSYQGDATAWFDYVPDQVGTWKFIFNFAGNYYPNGTYYNGKVYDSLAQIQSVNPGQGYNTALYLDSAYYQPSQSPVTTVTVQQEQVAGYPAAPLPTDYWTRPIPIDFREWWVIGGQYPFVGLGGGTDWPANTNTFASNYKFTPYVQGPNTAHVAWRRQGALAGVVGGQFGYSSVGPGESAYTGTPSIIFQGRAYQAVNKPAQIIVNGSTVTETTSVWQCFDIRTGQVYWEQTGIGTQVPTAVTFNIAASSEPGAGQTGIGTNTYSLLYIGSSRLIRYDPWSGAVQLNISIPVSSGTFYDDPNVLSVQTIGSGASVKYFLINWTVIGTSTDFNTRIVSNISYPFSSIGATDYESMVSVYTGTIIPAGAGTAQGQFIQGASLTTGKLLWNVTTSDIFFSTSTACADHGKYAVRMLGGWWDCWDLNTGSFVWQTAKPGASGGESYPWGDFGPYTTASYGGLLYDFSYAGFYALDWNTGKIVWHFTTPGTPFEAPWYPSMSLFSNSPIIADGKLYYANGEHSPTQPLSRGWRLWCLNATTGDVIWSKNGGGSPGAIADGYLTFDDRYDGYMYIFGKGPSATTVSAPQTAVTTGTSVVISGSVLDQSSSTVPSSTSPTGSAAPLKNNRGIADVACVSADSMSTYMEYLYDQEPIDGIYHNVTVTGVPVSIDAVDPNGNYVHIGTVTSDAKGNFGFAWTPTIAGQYQITASFAGDDAYSSSWASSYATVSQAPQATVAPTATPNGAATVADVMTYSLLGAVAVIIVIAIVAVLLLRKRP